MPLSLEEIVGHALRESAVRKRRPLRAYGVYVREDELMRSARFWADNRELDAQLVRRFIESAGGQRLGGRVRSPQFFLPGEIYRRLRSRTRSR